jgi:Spy/CpxP family protein refolding chaperone
MRKMIGLTLVGLAVGMLSSNVALAQRGRGRGGFGRGGFRMGPTQLLGMEQVQKELKLTDEQKDKIKPILDEANPFRGGGGGGNFQNLSEEERRARFEEMQKKSEEAGKKAVALLTDDQKTRFKQVEIWSNGTLSTLTQDEGVAKDLAVTDEQKSAFKTISEEVGKKMGEIFPKFQGASQDEQTKLREEMDQIRKDGEAEALAVLTPDQASKFEKLKGPKFELDRSQMFRGGRGRRGGNN